MIDTVVYEEMNASLVATVKGLSLNGCVDVFDLVPEDTSDVSFPCVAISQPDLTDQVGTGDSLLLDGKVPFVVTLLDNAGSKAVSQLKGQYTQWRRQLITAFQQKRFVLDNQSFTTSVDPRPVFDTKNPIYQGVASSFVVWCEFFDDRN